MKYKINNKKTCLNILRVCVFICIALNIKIAYDFFTYDISKTYNTWIFVLCFVVFYCIGFLATIRKIR